MSVASKINLVMKDVCNLGKDGKMAAQAGGYGYLSEERVVTTLHESMEKHGLVIVPVAMEVIDDREDILSSGKIMHDTRIRASYRFVDSEDGDFMDLQVLGEGSDTGDKTLNKCMTGAFKYALRQSFMISTGDDPDHVVSVEPTASTHRQPPPQPQSMRGPAQQATAQRTAGGSSNGQATEAQVTYISRLIDHRVDPFERDDFVSSTVGRAITEPGQLTKQEASKLIEVLNAMPERAAA
jgi:hypothetical protein